MMNRRAIGTWVAGIVLLFVIGNWKILGGHWATGLAVAVIFGHVAAGSLIWVAWGRINPEICPAGGYQKKWRSLVECLWLGTHVPAPKEILPADSTTLPEYSFGRSVPNWEASIPSWAIGVGERVFFTVVMGVVCADNSDVGVGVGSIVAWVTIKSGVNWGRGAPPDKKAVQRQLFVRNSVVSVAATMASLFFALLGGVIVCKW